MMLSRIGSSRAKRLYLKEWRENLGVSADAMGGRLGITRESVYRWEREFRRVNPDKQAAYANALGIEPEQLWHVPGTVSLDAMLHDASEETKKRAAEIISVLLKAG